MVINYRSGDENISISGSLERGYFIFYGIHRNKIYGGWTYSSAAGRFRSVCEAIRTLKKHRPQACALASVQEWQINAE